MIPVDLVRDGSPVTVATRTETKALLDDSAGLVVKPRRAARPRDPAIGGAAVHLDGKGDADSPADPFAAEIPRIIGRKDFTRNQLQTDPAPIRAEALSARSASSAGTRLGSDCSSASRSRGGGSKRGRRSHGWRRLRLHRAWCRSDRLSLYPRGRGCRAYRLVLPWFRRRGWRRMWSRRAFSPRSPAS